MLQTSAKPLQQSVAPEMEFEQLRQTWKEIGFSTQPADRKEAEAALKKIYATAGLEAPRKIVWCGSPFSQGLARAIVLDPEFLNQAVKSVWKNILTPAGNEFKDNIADSYRSSMRLFDTTAVKQSLLEALQNDVKAAMIERFSIMMPPPVRAGATEAVWDNVWKSVWESVGDSLWKGVDTGMRKVIETRQRPILDNSIKSSLNDCVGDSVKIKVWENPMDHAWGNVRNGIASQTRVRAWEGLWKSLQTVVWENVALRIGEHVKACGNNSAQASGYGQHDAYWLAFYAYFRDVHNLKAETEPIVALLDLAKSAGWFAPHANICWVCERPSKILLDSSGRLHADEGAALEYPDGWSLYATEGVLRQAKPVLQPA